MTEFTGIPKEGFNSPRSMASSMAKRYLQFKKAMPSSGYEEIFELVLNNRYKLLGNILSNPRRKEIVLASEGSLTLLTLFTMICENEGSVEFLKKNSDELINVINEIVRVLNEEAPDTEIFKFKDLRSKTDEYLSL